MQSIRCLLCVLQQTFGPIRAPELWCHIEETFLKVLVIGVIVLPDEKEYYCFNGANRTDTCPYGPVLLYGLPDAPESALVLERILGVAGLGSDWMTRVAARDRLGLAAWILALALLWLLSRPLEREDA